MANVQRDTPAPTATLASSATPTCRSGISNYR